MRLPPSLDCGRHKKAAANIAFTTAEIECALTGAAARHFFNEAQNFASRATPFARISSLVA